MEDSASAAKLVEEVLNPPKDETPKQKKRRRGCQKYVFWAVFALVAVIALLVFLATFAPSVFLVIINIIWLFLLGIVVIFLLLGVLVMVGLKEEAQNLINVMLEGSLNLIEVADFFKEALNTFQRYLKELFLFIMPIFAFSVGTLLYLALLIAYKSYGREHDVFWFTVVITIVMIFAVSVFNRPKKPDNKPKNWIKEAQEKFTKSFKDSLEIIIFIFFLTIDRTDLFFLPAELNIELHAQVGDYNLMKPGITIDSNIGITISLVMAAIMIEIIRNIIRLSYQAYINYKIATKILDERNKDYRTADVIKLALRQSVKTSQDELMKFITFTTILISVFLLFPRLKLLTVGLASLTSLFMDFIISGRLKMEKGDDLISRIISKVFRL
ncbi:hypothetical protein KC909_00955 [Candidatus Dojkabacteria bacterium]|uniref:Uncharacterized protein n=1 Tax=Candidatus Dojkabacteria bacterium TaxID=2099670 RepID=A0A955L4U0_9BACT|nr:hypothetical protein [Candidatus Dojkabacteria bacterium]